MVEPQAEFYAVWSKLPGVLTWDVHVVTLYFSSCFPQAMERLWCKLVEFVNESSKFCIKVVGTFDLDFKFFF